MTSLTPAEDWLICARAAVSLPSVEERVAEIHSLVAIVDEAEIARRDVVFCVGHIGESRADEIGDRQRDLRARGAVEAEREVDVVGLCELAEIVDVGAR